jgi:hypothetical protein
MNRQEIYDALKNIQKRDYRELLKICPEGVKHGNWTYREPIDYTHGNGGYETFLKVVKPIQEKLINQVIEKILTKGFPKFAEHERNQNEAIARMLKIK